jgi:hypothetical protein
VAVLIVEMCLVDGLSEIFTPSLVARMTDDRLDELASELKTARNNRRHLKEKEALLDEAYRQCKRNIIGTS